MEMGYFFYCDVCFYIKLFLYNIFTLYHNSYLFNQLWNHAQEKGTLSTIVRINHVFEIVHMWNLKVIILSFKNFHFYVNFMKIYLWGFVCRNWETWLQRPSTKN
jgi:hypothetical protein